MSSMDDATVFVVDDDARMRGGIATVVLRLVSGVVVFAHGVEQKMRGWFGGLGFAGTMGFFTGTMHIPAPFAFLAICAEFFGGMGPIIGFLTRIAALPCNFTRTTSVLIAA